MHSAADEHFPDIILYIRAASFSYGTLVLDTENELLRLKTDKGKTTHIGRFTDTVGSTNPYISAHSAEQC